MVVRHRVHPVLRRGHGENLWEGARHHHPEPQLWDRLPVRLDDDGALRGAGGTWATSLPSSALLKTHHKQLPCISLPSYSSIILALMCLTSLHKSADDIFGLSLLVFFFFSKSSKVLAKRELLYVPLIGWTWYFLEIVFCKRKWEEDRDTVIEGLKRLSDYPEYMWVSVECVGSRSEMVTDWCLWFCVSGEGVLTSRSCHKTAMLWFRSFWDILVENCWNCLLVREVIWGAVQKLQTHW